MLEIVGCLLALPSLETTLQFLILSSYSDSPTDGIAFVAEEREIQRSCIGLHRKSVAKPGAETKLLKSLSDVLKQKLISHLHFLCQY